MEQQGAARKIAVTVWGNRVSPVFDAARTLLIAEIENSTLVGGSHLVFDPEHPQELVRLLRNQQVMTLICGAISEGPAALFEAAGLTLIPFITGDVRSVLDQYLQAQPFGAEFSMPGCGKNICCRGKIRRGRAIGAGHGPPHPVRGEGVQPRMRDPLAADDLPETLDEGRAMAPTPDRTGNQS